MIFALGHYPENKKRKTFQKLIVLFVNSLEPTYINSGETNSDEIYWGICQL